MNGPVVTLPHSTKLIEGGRALGFSVVRVAAALLCLACDAGFARAANQDEIQVYDYSINKPGAFGLELHINGTPAGRVQPDYPGEITNEHGVRFTPEFSYGVTRDIEVGLYLDTEVDGNGTSYFVGAKYRLKWMPLHPEDNGGWFAGTNWEFSRVGYRFSESQDVLELRGIVGYKGDDWLFVVNPVFDWYLSNGLESPDPEFTASFKYAHKVVEGLSLGVEYYGDIGQLGRVAPLNQQDQRLYAVADIEVGSWGFNVGVGRGFTAQADAWTIKAIVEVPVQELLARK